MKKDEPFVELLIQLPLKIGKRTIRTQAQLGKWLNKDRSKKKGRWIWHYPQE